MIIEALEIPEVRAALTIVQEKLATGSFSEFNMESLRCCIGGHMKAELEAAGFTKYCPWALRDFEGLYRLFYPQNNWVHVKVTQQQAAVAAQRALDGIEPFFEGYFEEE